MKKSDVEIWQQYSIALKHDGATMIQRERFVKGSALIESLFREACPNRRSADFFNTILTEAVTRHPLAAALRDKPVDWLISPEGQHAIAGYKINGEQLFYPNAGDPNA